MTWVDVVLVLLIAVTAMSGYKRGVVQELFDLLVVGIGAAVALRFFDDVARWLQRLASLQGGTSHWIAFLLLFIPVAALIVAIGMHLDQMSEEDRTLPDAVKFGFGAVLAGIKGVFLAWMVLVALHFMPFVDAGMRSSLKHAPVVQAVQGLTPTFVSFVGSVTPTRVSRWLVPAMERQF